MQHWVNNTVDIGDVVGDTKINILFTGKEGIPKIRSVSTGCGCTSYSYDKKNRILKVVYRTGRFIKEVKIHRLIKVFYIDGTYDVLGFTGKKIR